MTNSEELNLIEQETIAGTFTEMQTKLIGQTQTWPQMETIVQSWAVNKPRQTT